MKLAQIAMVLPVQTADVERGFSAQNNILTAKRNRLLVATQNMLLKQKIEGQKVRDDQYMLDLVSRWKSKKTRKLFTLRQVTRQILKERQLSQASTSTSAESTIPSTSTSAVCTDSTMAVDEVEEEKLGENVVELLDEAEEKEKEENEREERERAEREREFQEEMVDREMVEGEMVDGEMVEREIV